AKRGPLQFIIEGMDCGDCALTIEKAVSRIPGVEAATVSFGTARLAVKESAPGQPGIATSIERIVSEAGYRATPLTNRQRLEQAPFWKREPRVLTTVGGTLVAVLAFGLSLLAFPVLLVNSLFAVALIVGGASFARAGLLAART